MPARKKPPSNPAAPLLDTASLIVILEDMRSQFTAFGEALQSSREESNRRFDQVDQRFLQVDRRFDQQDLRFASLECDVRDIRRELGDVQRELGDVQRDLAEVHVTVDRIETTLTSKVNRDEVESIVQRP